MNEPEQVLKTDAVGRMHTPRERRERILDEFEQSGLSGAEFSKLVGIKYQTFANWASKRRRERVQCPTSAGDVSTVAKVRWLEAVPGKSEASHPGVLTIHLPGGACIQASDSKQVALAAHLVRLLAC